MYVILIAWAVATLYPFLFLLLTSFKGEPEFFTNPFGLPRAWIFNNYVTAWTEGRVPVFALNSIFVTIVSTILAMILASTLSFALSRFKFRIKPIIWVYILFGFLVNDAVRLLPLVIFLKQLHLNDNLVGLSLVYAASGIPFNVVFYVAFMESIPRELEEAAVMDGASMWQVFWSIIMPLSQPATVTLATFQALYAWNEYILALLLLGQNTFTLPVGLSIVITGKMASHYTIMAALLFMAMMPALIFFIVLQKQVIKGFSAGALKG
jgi:raffinose/stachyose/melibiose transport system permease protein